MACSVIFELIQQQHIYLLILINNYHFITFYSFMTKQQTTKTKRCGKHSLKLTGKAKAYFKGTVIVDFKPITKNKPSKNNSIIPTFNQDGKYFTSAFHLPNSQKQSDQNLLQDHQKRVIQSQAEISQIYVSKPRSKQKYCGVCRNYYQDYLQHTTTESHILKLQNSVFQKFLIEESLKFKMIIQKQSEVEFQKGNLDSSCQTVNPSQFQVIQDYFNLN